MEMNYTFSNPEYFWALLIIPALTAWYIWRQHRYWAPLTVSSVQPFAALPKTYKIYLRHLPFALRMASLAFIIAVIARPQSTDSWENSTTFGIDIILSIDVSSSMLAEDLKPNRLEASKNVAISFVNSRPYDRIGLVIFSGESFTQCPLTTDRAVLLNLFKGVQCGIINDGTAIGMGLANAVARLRETDSKSKVVILLTDGVNNQGDIDPLTAAEIAQAYGVRVYTIGVGTQGVAPYPVQTPFGTTYQDMEVDIDEDVLKEIARLTGGKYFRATDNTSLSNVYTSIDALEKSRVEVNQFSKKNEEYLKFGIIAIVFLLAEFLLRRTILRNIP